jgi:hypothetical protein
MEPFSTLQAALGSYETLNKYLMNGDLHFALNVLGEVGIDAAKEALSSSKLAKNPREQIVRAIGHLQFSQAAYQRRLSNTNLITNLVQRAKMFKVHD